MTKENDGRGARRKLLRRLLAVGVSFGSFLIILFLLRHQRAGSGHYRSSGSTRHQQHQMSEQELQFSKAQKLHQKFKHKRPKKKRLSLRDDDDTDVKKDSWDADKDLLDSILSASVHLIDLYADNDELSQQSEEGSYAGVYGQFCRLNWQMHKDDPSATPMFRDLVQKSPDCQEHHRTMDLKKVADAARAFDAENSEETPKVLDLSAVVFHESRCGSTLVANMFVAASPSEHRVYSESTPPIMALKNVCGESYTSCSLETAAAILQDVLYLMSRSDDAQEKRVFFKIQSIGTRNLAVFQQAFPDTPWLFVYREPVQVLMSQLAHGTKNANCVRAQRHSNSNPLVSEIVRRHHEPDPRRLSPQDYCAAHLASITETAAEGLGMSQGMAWPINYKDLPDILIDTILPEFLHVPVGPAERHRIQQTAQQYSKGRGGKKAGEFEQDSEQKEARASSEIRQAAETYLSESYQALELAAARMKEQQ